MNGKLVTQNCAPGLHWNQDQKICDWSHNVPCNNNLNKFGNRGDVDLSILNKPCKEGTYANYPGNCNQYLVCLWGTYAVFSCASGLYWNNNDKVCDWPNKVNCVPGKPVESTTMEMEEESEPEGEELKKFKKLNK